MGESILAERTNVDESLLRISSQMDEFEGYASPHGRRIAAIAESLGSAFNLASRDRFFLQQAALLHDIGEMSMNREYIRSPRVLTANERIDLERHPVIGGKENPNWGCLCGVQLIVRWHHDFVIVLMGTRRARAEQTPGLGSAGSNVLWRRLRVADRSTAFSAWLEDVSRSTPGQNGRNRI